jgi:general secretion pathway protein K
VAWIPAPEKPQEHKDTRQSGIALFMVIGAISVLSILVTEFSYVAQVNQKLAFDGMDQLKAHYLAKTGLKLSLLRLKAYLSVKNYVNGMVKAAGGGAAASSMVPKSLLDKIWSFPFIYPLPTTIPGMTPADKEKVEAFQKASALEGKFSATIAAESSKFNLNSILQGYAMPSPSPSASPSPTTPGTPPRPNPSASPSGAPSFNPEAARNQLKTYLAQLMAPKMEDDPQFADAYRDPHLLDDLMDNIVAWADPSYERKSSSGDFIPKKGPFYSVTELHMIPGMDDDLYNLFAPNLTVARTSGINVNSMQEAQLRAFFPLATKDEVEQFFKDRDSDEQDGTFKSEEDFYKYVQSKFQAYQKGGALEELKKQLGENNIHFVVDETEFKITVRAEMNQSSRTIEAWVTLGTQSGTPSTGPSPVPSAVPGGGATVNLSGNGPAAPPPDPGVKIHYMRVL